MFIARRDKINTLKFYFVRRAAALRPLLQFFGVCYIIVSAGQSAARCTKMKKQIFNPILPEGEYIGGAEAHVFGKRVYIYGCHDSFGADTGSTNDYVCWSAPVGDLRDWRCEGVIYKKEQDPLNPEGDRLLFAPDVCRGADGRYYLYYALDYVSVISVAVCDEPAGKYAFLGYVRFPDGHILSSREGEPFAFDPAILRDEGKNYLYVGYCPYPPEHIMRVRKSYDHAWVYRLADDMLTIVGEPESVLPSFSNSQGTGFEGHEFFRAPSVRRAGEEYVLVYASHSGHELCYATSPSPVGPFAFGGTIISNGDIGIDDISDEADCNNYTGNNHGCIEKIGGKWYVFYNRHTNRNTHTRQVCAEEITLAGGGIKQVGMTSCGLNGGPLVGKGDYSAAIACVLKSRSGTMRGEVPLRGIHPYIMQDCPDGGEDGQYIANFRRCAVCGFKYFSPAGAKNIAVTARGGGRGKLIVSDGLNNLSVISLSTDDGWKSFSAPFSTPREQFALFFIFIGDGDIDIKGFSLY